MKKIAIMIIFSAFLAVPCAAEIIIVDQQWPYDFNNIQAAIDYAGNGDYIIVFPGTYTGYGNRNIDFLGKAITVRSLFPDDPCIVAATIIDCSGEPHNGFLFQSDEDANSVLDGFTVTGCLNEGGGICCRGGRAGNASPSIFDCIITANVVGIYCYESSPKITGCTITDNSDGGIYCRDSSPIITECIITDNRVSNMASYPDGAVYCYDSNAVITESSISHNNSIGIHCEDGNTTIADCVITGNQSHSRAGAGIAVFGGLCRIYNSIINGNNSPDFGGAISCRDASSLMVIGSTMSDNSASSKGGAIDSRTGSIRVENCTITGNSAGSGGGICCWDSNAIIAGCIITDNNSNSTHASLDYGGGGICCERSNVTVTDCTITDNFTGSHGGGINSRYGNTTITGCTVNDNTAGRGGGGILDLSVLGGYVQNCTISSNTAGENGGGLYGCWGVKNCAVTENSAENGGGLYGCGGVIEDCTIANNSAGNGGGISLCFSSIINCIISQNSADYEGGGAHFSHRRAGEVRPTIFESIITANSAEYGGGIYCKYLDPNVVNSTIVGNSAGYGGGINCDYDSNATITNSVLWDNFSLEYGYQIFVGGNAGASLSYTDLQGGRDDINVDPNGTLNWLLGNIDIDPCFVEPGYWDANGTLADPNDDFWVDGDYHLKSAGWSWDAEHGRWTYDDVTSRCIDAGNPGSPLVDEPLAITYDPYNEFGQNLRINMGAYGGTAQASMPPYDWALVSDMTNDGISDFNDLQILSSLWLNTGQHLYADFNRDEDIDFLDFALLADDWLKQTSWH
jgi:parallel beta-helix repeat protein